jgi:hypothetical protein
MFRRFSLLALALALSAAGVSAQGDKGVDPIKPAASKVVAVTAYQNTALVTREVTLPELAGIHEVVVSPLPPFTLQSSLYAEGSENFRVLSVRYRTRAIAEDTREEVRKVEAQIKTLNAKMQTHQSELKAIEENMKLLDKLEGFTAKSLESITDKGMLDSEKIIAMAKFVQDDRTKRSKEKLATTQAMADTKEQLDFTTRLLAEKSGGSVRTERDAVILMDKKAGGGTVRLNYLVSNASWRPQYKLRTGGKEKDSVSVEYQAAIDQQTGEDWTNVALTLSTAQPMLNAAPPDLRALEVSVGGTGVAFSQAPGLPGGGPATGAGGRAGVGGPAGMPPASAIARDLDKLAKDQRKQSVDNYNAKNPELAGKLANDAAANEQFRDLLEAKEELEKDAAGGRGLLGDGPSVTYAIKGKLTIPSRNDEQVIEIAKLEMAPKFYYKAVPVLTPNVYRLADLVNTSDYVLLPGEATMYMAGDFVGQSKLPLVAVGKPFTVGFGIDPQLQVTRKLVDKTRTTQGGNQVLTFKYRIQLSSYKTVAVPVQVWDRMPHAEAAMTIAINLANPKPELSTEPLYVRDEKPKGLLRWDVNVAPNQNAEKVLTIDYEFKMELDKNVNIGAFQAK